MGDMADVAIERGELELWLHQSGQCGWACAYCEDEMEDERLLGVSDGS